MVEQTQPITEEPRQMPTPPIDATITTGEAMVFVEAARSVPADSLTACSGWTAHDVLAHVVAGGAEIARLVGRHLEGAEVGPTTSFEEREPAFREVLYADLVDLVAGGGILDLLAGMANGGAAETLRFTGWDMDAATLALHVRSELAIHRWDLVGSDPVSRELLGRPELTAHAVRALGAFDVIGERAVARASSLDAGSTLDVRLRAEGHADVAIRVMPTGTELAVVEPAGDAAITTDAAARLLLLWGRNPWPAHRAVTGLASRDLRVLERWLRL